MSHHGLGGRLNGPVDNPISSCISCHSKAAITAFGLAAPMADFALNRQSFTSEAFKKYFGEIAGGIGLYQPDTIKYYKLDYSLQLSAGIRNFYQSKIYQNKVSKEASTFKYPSSDNSRKKYMMHRTIMYRSTLKKREPRGLFFNEPGDLPEVTRNGLLNAQ